MPYHSRIPTTTSLWKKLGWLALIWATSVIALGVIALLLRLVMNAVGMTS